MNPGGARLFVALMLGAQASAQLAAEARERLEGCGLGPAQLRLPRPEGLHLTLYFLGNVPAGSRPELTGSLGLELANLPGPELRLGRGGCFPERGPARVLWVGLRELGAGDRLETLQRRVRKAVGQAGLENRSEESRPFRPHLTVARPRSQRGLQRSLLEPFLGWEAGRSFRPAAVSLVESVSGDGPPRYVERESFPLGPGG